MNLLLSRLKRLHIRLEDELARERKERLPDHDRITRIKKLKLAIKDRLHRTAPRAVRAG